MAKQASRDLRVVPLASTHDRASFSSGVNSLDTYLKTQAGQDVRRKANAVFVMVRADDPTRVLGYFTLCATTLTQGEIPEPARKHIPRYPLVSATLIGRLAVAKEEQGQGLGGILLAHALRNAYKSAGTVGSCMVVVDAIDEGAAGFYAAHGFVRLPESMRLILPMRMVGRLLRSANNV
jgi:GNAT superfamily N-acetyltransferase